MKRTGFASQSTSSASSSSSPGTSADHNNGHSPNEAGSPPSKRMKTYKAYDVSLLVGTPKTHGKNPVALYVGITKRDVKPAPPTEIRHVDGVVISKSSALSKMVILPHPQPNRPKRDPDTKNMVPKPLVAPRHLQTRHLKRLQLVVCHPEVHCRYLRILYKVHRALTQ